MRLNRIICLSFILASLTLMFLPALGQETLPLVMEELVMVLEETSYHLDSPAAPLLKAIQGMGTALEVAEAESCLFTGKDKEFYTDTLLIGTLPRGPQGADVIETIMVLSGPALTARGVGIGSTAEDLLSAYGEPTREEQGTWYYCIENRQDTPSLSFTLDPESQTVLYYTYFLNTQG